MAVLGVNCKKQVIFVVHARWSKGRVKFEAARAIATTIRDPRDVFDVIYARVHPVLDAARAKGIKRVVILACASGRYKAANAAVKAEAVVELASAELGLAIEHITPQSLKKALACAAKESWQDRAEELFNPTGAIDHWSAGMNGAAAAAYKATMPRPPSD